MYNVHVYLHMAGGLTWVNRTQVKILERFHRKFNTNLGTGKS